MVKRAQTNKKTKYENVQRKNKGITLIALVITIIVILILAGVSINTLFGDNGLLTKAQDAANANKEAGARDKVAVEVLASYDNDGTLNAETLKANLEARKWTVTKGGTDKTDFPVTVTVDGYTFQINEEGKIDNITVADTPTTPEGDTRPLVNELTSLQNGKVRARDSEGKTVVVPAKYKFAGSSTDKVSTGIVIQDGSGNEYVWIEVPKTVYQQATVTAIKAKEDAKAELTDNEYNLIYDDLKTYGSAYKDYKSEGDEWYASKLKEYPDGIGIVETYGENEEKNNSELTDEIKALDTGCGLNYNDYYALKNKMLKSIYENEGFWIGRYEAGIETARSKSDGGKTTLPALSQENKYPYNWVTCSEAQKLASNMKASGSEVTSSLMFGVQWNLVCRFIKENVTELGGYTNGDIDEAILWDSSEWGNFIGFSSRPTEFEINRGRYIVDPMNSNTWKLYTEDTKGSVENKVKKNEKSVLLTTGASDRNKVLNIYDFAGNVWEWTLEQGFENNGRDRCLGRGSFFNNEGCDPGAAIRYVERAIFFDDCYGFRISCVTLLVRQNSENKIYTCIYNYPYRFGCLAMSSLL